MLNYLLIMRHAKSSWKDEGLADHDRPLNKRGRESADRIAQILTAKHCAPDIIWSSDAQRTKETALRMIRVIPGAQQISYEPGFYMAGALHVLDLLSAAKEPDGALMLLGHNPGWEGLFAHFSGHHERFPTGACAVFARKDPAADWRTSEAWQFKELLRPRDLMNS